MRTHRGENPYQQMLQLVPVTRFSDSSTPALGGMVTIAHTRTREATHTHTHTHTHKALQPTRWEQLFGALPH